MLRKPGVLLGFFMSVFCLSHRSDTEWSQDTDRYGRLVGTLYTPEGMNVNLEMVCNGSAWWYSRYAKNNREMASCQDEAKEAGLGLWADDDPMPPWEWRRR